MFGTQGFSDLYYFLMIYPLNSYVGLLIFLGYLLSVAIPGYHSSFLFSITFNLSANVHFLNYLLASLLFQVWLSAYRPLCNYLLLVSNTLSILAAVQNFLLKFNYCNYVSLDLFLLKYAPDCLVQR